MTAAATSRKAPTITSNIIPNASSASHAPSLPLDFFPGVSSDFGSSGTSSKQTPA